MSGSMLSLYEKAVVDRLHELDMQLTDVFQQTLGVQWITKEESLLMQGIAKVLDIVQDVKTVAHLVGVDIPLAAPDGALFLNSFATTIKQTAALPRDWYAATPKGVSARWRVRGHEWQHALQDQKGVEGMKGWPKTLQHSALYLAGCIAHTPDGEQYLAKVEGDAYGVTAYAVSFFGGAPPPIEGMLGNIRSSYNMLGSGPVQAEDVLRSHYGSMSAGSIPNVTAARITRDFLYGHGGDLRGRVQL